MEFCWDVLFEWRCIMHYIVNPLALYLRLRYQEGNVKGFTEGCSVCFADLVGNCIKSILDTLLE